jgi:hypothetical protein
MPRVHRSLPLTAAALAGALAVLLTAGSAQADWLVTRDGARLETKGAWKVDGRRVLFTMPNGTLSTMRTDEIDLDQSALVTTQAKEAPPVPEVAIPVKKEPVLRLTEKDIPPMGALAEAEASGTAAKPGEDKDAVPSPLEVISWEKTENATGDGLEIFGTIKNGGTNIITTPTLLVAIYDTDGGLLASVDGEVNSPQIQPGKTANFRVAVPGITDFTTAKFDAQGRGYKPRAENSAVDESEIPEYDESNETPVEEEPTPDADEPPPV